jgi:hypothetical protein
MYDFYKNIEAFDYKCPAFSKITRLFEDIFIGIESFLNLFPEKWRLFSFQYIFREVEVFV